jgi:hypothetical protein
MDGTLKMIDVYEGENLTCRARCVKQVTREGLRAAAGSKASDRGSTRGRRDQAVCASKTISDFNRATPNRLSERGLARASRACAEAAFSRVFPCDGT